MTSTPARPRELKPDLIRCVALFFVMGVHFYTHCDIYNAGYTGLAAILSELMRTLFTPALALFLMLSGYFQRGKRLSARYYLGILRLLEMYFICAVLNLLYTRFYLGVEMSARDFIGAIVNFTATEYSWYILLYGGLFMLIPFLNLAYASLSCRGHKRILILSFFLLSSLPFSVLNTFVNLCAYWWQRIWPVMFYFMGAYIGEYRPEISVKKCAAWLLGALGVFTAFNYLVFDASSPFYGHAAQSFLYTHEGLQNAVLTPLVFLFVMSLDVSRCPAWLAWLIRTVAKYSYGAFLFSSITDSFVYGWLRRLVPVAGQRYLFFIVALPLSYAAAVALSALADRLVNVIDRALRPLMAKLFDRLYALIAPDAAEEGK